MVLALRQEDVDELVVLPPAVDWQAALDLVDDLNDFRGLIDQFDASTRVWLAGLNANFQNGVERIANLSAGYSKDEVADALVPLLNALIDTTSDAVEAHAVPLHEQKNRIASFERIRGVSGAPGRFLRKQVNRIEDIRVKRHNALVDLYYALLAFKSELERDGDSDRSFGDPKSLGDFLRKQVA